MKQLKITLFICIIFISIFFLSTIIISAFKIDHVITERPTHTSIPETYIVVIAQEFDNPFWRLLEQGALTEATKHNTIIDYMGPQRINQQEQILLLEKAIHLKPDGIIIQGIVNEKYTQLIDNAYEIGIPIVTVDADVNESKRISYIGTNQEAAGKLLGEYIIGDDTKKQYIGVIVGSLVAENQIERLEGLKSVVERSKHSEIIDVRSSNISRIKAADETVHLLEQYPYINTIIGLSSLDAAGITDGLIHIKNNKTSINVYGFDQLSITKELIEKKEVVATLAQQPELMGAKAVSTLIDFLQGRPVQDKQYIPATLMTQQ